MTTFVEVALNIPGKIGRFDYHLPGELEGKIFPGSLVVVPFGRQRLQAVVTRRVEQPSVPETRPVESLLDPRPVLTAAQLKLAEWLASETLAPLGACVELMLPPGMSQQGDSQYALTDMRIGELELDKPQQRLVDLLTERGPLRGRQIEAALPRRNWRNSAQALVRKGLVTSQPVLPEPEVHIKTTRLVALGIDPAKIAVHELELGKQGGQAYQRRRAILEFLAGEGEAVETSWVFASTQGNSVDLRYLAERGLVEFEETERMRDPLENVLVQPDTPPQLTPDQSGVWAEIEKEILADDRQAFRPFLLHGVTGSGKTEIYLRAVAAVLAQGKQAIVLVPEIALTPQTVRRFMARFPGKVGLIHSKLAPGERYDTWRRARAGLLDVIVGPRSALFAPLPRPGLVVIDEFHDSSFYQSEPAPAYHTVRAALAYARFTQATLVMGSATPEVHWMYRARQNHWPVLDLTHRVAAHRQVAGTAEPEQVAGSLPLPPVEVVDMRQELKAGNHSIFSRALLEELEQVVARQQQAILFLNRLGTATYVFCRSCGFVLKCPRCDRTLTYHAEAHELVCHSCNYRRKMPAVCPQCGSNAIRQYGTGTERVEQELLKQMPKIRAMRWDSQVTRKKGAHDLILTQFSAHQADVLIGTQMLAKGLDLPLVTLVGVVLADVGLYLEDFRAPERTFQLLTQVEGRAGRSPLGGKVVLQTFQPEHYAIQAAAGHDYDRFYAREIEERRDQGYPPFSRLARLELRGPRADEIEAGARKMTALVQHWIDETGSEATRIIGPAPCFFPRLAGNYRWQIIIAGPDPLKILRGRDLGDWRVEIDPQALL